MYSVDLANAMVASVGDVIRRPIWRGCDAVGRKKLCDRDRPVGETYWRFNNDPARQSDDGRLFSSDDRNLAGLFGDSQNSI